MDASPAVTACFSGSELEIMQNHRAIWELTLAFPALMASQQQAVRPITVVNSPFHHQTPPEVPFEDSNFVRGI